ncbi:MAG: hypothetical protein NVSMB58_18090 [Terriglobales bacterium]
MRTSGCPEPEHKYRIRKPSSVIQRSFEELGVVEEISDVRAASVVKK